ncbi:hypothetical protein [uncultured Lacinutrix sp.]|uniref:hypothetical protein n=1 Tax=uncultured Lacinutrix sp. TaxID=574032 RepID=UPI00261BA3CE|nr:hypothetical protein [uncultured Lacinutrix sp.]
MSKTLIIVLSIISFIIILAIIGAKRRETKLRALIDSREPLAKEDYVKHFIKKGFTKKHIEVLHDKLNEFIGLEGYSVYPDDDLRELYGFEDLDDIEFINQIIIELNLRQLNDADYNETERYVKLFNAEYILTLIKKVNE